MSRKMCKKRDRQDLRIAIIPPTLVYTLTHTYTQTHRHTYKYTQTHRHTFTYTYTYTHILTVHIPLVQLAEIRPNGRGAPAPARAVLVYLRKAVLDAALVLAPEVDGVDERLLCACAEVVQRCWCGGGSGGEV